MILLLRGGDALAVRNRLQELRDEADGGTGMLATNLTIIEGRDAQADEIIGPAMTVPFLAPHRLVIVEGFLDRWDSDRSVTDEHADGGATAAPPARRGRQIEAFRPLFDAIASGFPPTTILVLHGGAVARSNPMVTALKAIPGVTDEVHAEPKPGDLPRYIRDQATARGVRFRSAQAAEAHYESAEWLRERIADPVILLARLTNGNTLMIANELDKLALYTMGREVTIDDVYALCSGARDIDNFAYLDAVLDGKHLDALLALESLWKEMNTAQLLITNLTTRYRQVATVAEILERGGTVDEAAKVLGNVGRYPGLRDAAIRRARRIGIAGARRALEAIVEAELAHKTGETKELVAFELLTAKLCAINNPGQQAAGGRRR